MIDSCFFLHISKVLEYTTYIDRWWVILGIISGVTNSKKSVWIEYEYLTIEFEYLLTSIQFSKDEVEYHVEYLSNIE